MTRLSDSTILVGADDVEKVQIGGSNSLVFIGGPCAVESESHALSMGEAIKHICDKLEIPLIYKSCYDKDCRSAPGSFHGLGPDEGLKILAKVRAEIGVPVVSDFSDASWAKATGEVCDMVQVPAYLCRQSTILKAAAETQKPIHLKKGQYMSPWNMKNSVKKLKNFGAEQILLADRGSFFGYNMLVNDFRSLPIMAETGCPVCFDATHSIQLPTSMGDISGGQREFIPYLVRAAASCGINALFMEVHDDPPRALSDSNTVLDLKYLEMVLSQAKSCHNLRIELARKFGDNLIHTDEN